MDRKYWEEYYAASGPSQQPSDFARFCAGLYKKSYSHIFDIGCGNGRDTLFFGSRSLRCTGIDQCEVAISKNESKRSLLGVAASFVVADFSTYDYEGTEAGAYSLYSRFTLHAISVAEEDRLFLHLNSGKRLKALFIEARSIRDDLYGQGEQVGPHEFVTSHYRRFIDPDTLKERLEENYDIEYFKEARGFARTETEDPCLIRVVATRRST